MQQNRGGGSFSTLTQLLPIDSEERFNLFEERLAENSAPYVKIFLYSNSFFVMLDVMTVVKVYNK